MMRPCFLSRFDNGALGSFEATRFAPGHRCTNSFEINGSKGSVKFDFERMNELQVYFTEDAEDVQASAAFLLRILRTLYGRMVACRAYHRYEHTFIHEVLELMDALEQDRQPVPNFHDGVKCQQVLEAVDLSIERRTWVEINEL